jgi:nitrate/TMAO reductase-like tetraheme cytochrome c subunit
MNENENESVDLEPSADVSVPKARRSWGRMFRRLVLKAAALGGAFLLFIALGTAGAGWYTSRPQFCRSCHIMEPYFVSWQESSHKDVSCIKCHFGPGVGEKVRGKLLGLVQLAKYVTRSEGPRPAAEIPDASCLRSGCHETRTLVGDVDFHGIPFDHKPHLEQLRRGKKLRCTSCHAQIVQGSHMTVTASTCFLCHFKGGFFNEGLGACTRCHQIPEEEFDLGGGVMFNHDLAFERGVDCAHCHADLVSGNGEVPEERCGVCHNRKGDLARRDDHEFVHQKHVTEHKVDCLDCHLAIHHSLDLDKIEHAAGDCQSCHPDHHREQVNLLRGIGGSSIPAHDSSMVAARIACPACHRQKKISSTGTVTWEASIATCAECHEGPRADQVRTYQRELDSALSELRLEARKIRTALESADFDEGKLATMSAQLVDVEKDLDFLGAANGIHNVHYATSLTQAVLDQVILLSVQLELGRPMITLPELME